MGKRLFCIIVFLVIGVLVSVYCIQSILKDETKTDSIISNSCYIDDFREFEEIIKDNFPLYSYVASKKNMDDIWDKYETKVSSEIKTDDSFEKVLKDVCEEFDGYCHLSVLDKQQYQVYLNHLNDEKVEYGDATKAALLTEKAKIRYSLANGNGIYTYLKKDNIEVTFYDEYKTLRVRINSFLSDEDLIEKDRDKIVSIYTEYPQAENIIFDITGNCGGSSLYWMEVIVRPFGDCVEYTESIAFKDNEYNKRNLPFYRQAKQVEEDDFGFNMVYKEKIILDYSDEESLGFFNPNISKWVFIDDKCYSATDQFARFCKETSWAHLVGTRTSGNGIGGTPSLFALKNTGYLIRLSTVGGYNLDGSLNLIIGTEPDYYKLPKERIMETFLRNVR